MINKDQVKAKLDTLTAYCEANGHEGGGYAGYISVLYPAIEQYFNSVSAELGKSVRDLITHLYTDLLLRDMKYENPVGGPLPTNYPAGYHDLTSIFNGNGALDAILAMDEKTFLNGFPIETSTDAESGSTTETVLANPIIAVWTEQLSTAHSAEIDKIQNIMDWIENYSFGRELINLFEDRGKVTMSKGKKDFAQNIYIDMKIKEVIETFALDVWVPTYLR